MSKTLILINVFEFKFSFIVVLDYYYIFKYIILVN